MIKYYASNFKTLEDAEGEVSPESIAPLVLVHYPVNEGWDVTFYDPDVDSFEAAEEDFDWDEDIPF